MGKKIMSKVSKGVGEEIEANIVQCIDCKRILVSNTVHDFVDCPCGSFTDGGNDYYRRAGNLISLRVFKDVR